MDLYKRVIKFLKDQHDINQYNEGKRDAIIMTQKHLNSKMKDKLLWEGEIKNVMVTYLISEKSIYQSATRGGKPKHRSYYNDRLNMIIKIQEFIYEN